MILKVFNHGEINNRVSNGDRQDEAKTHERLVLYGGDG